MLDDLRRLELTPGAMYNFHPGSHVGQGSEKGIELISSMLARILGSFDAPPATTVLLETMSGKGSEVGRNFEEIRAIIDATESLLAVPDSPVLGVCLDTCHVWDGGYDIVEDLDGVLEEFDRVVGLARLKAIHLNDSMNALAAHKDRHAKIGKGKIGLDALARVVNHPKLRELPFFLETPCDLQGYKSEIALLRGIWR
jgi:deoxyribonuclease-4